MRLLQSVVLALSIVLFLAAPGGAQQRTPTRDEVRTMLSGVEQGPSAEEWQGLAPATLGVLVAVADDASELPVVRLRAIGAAAYFATAEARRFLLRTARARAAEGLVVRAVVRALARGWGAAAVGDVAGFAAHDDVAVREAVISALASMRGDAEHGAEATRVLRARVSVERDEALAAQLRQALQG